MRLTKLFTEFFDSEKAGGIVLIVCTVISLIISNSALRESYLGFWNIPLGHHSLIHWINDGLMTIFFLLIGLELEREIYIGELSKIKNAALPFAAALGGMAIPAVIYMYFNHGNVTEVGAGIPMATDIAFALGVLSLLGKRVPASLKVFLTALAVIDDLGAILIIAFFYSKGIVLTNLLIALGTFAGLCIFNRLKIHSLILYLGGGVVMWYFMLNSGVHATVAGVLLAFAIPFSNGSEKSPSYLLQHWLHIPVAFFVLPVFALANTAIDIKISLNQIIGQPYALGILSGLVIGKPLGVLLFCALIVKLGLGKLPRELSWGKVAGAGSLAGIGFTMSIFITLLAFSNEALINNAKIIILISSLLSAVFGFLILNLTTKTR